MRRNWLEIEAVAENHFGDEVVGGAGEAYAYAELDFPLRSEIEIDGRKNLVLLLAER